MNHKPVTPLPWEETFAIPSGSADGSWGVCVAEGGDVIADYIEQRVDAIYITHAANAYPKLVTRAQNALRAADAVECGSDGIAYGEEERDKALEELRAALRELGEKA
jgi:hypothetical protein